MPKRPVLACYLFLAFVGSLLAVGPPPRGEDPDKGPGAEADLLRRVGLKTEPDSLVTFFRQMIPAPAERKRFAALIAQLGDADFAAREKATAVLRAAGPAALPQLRQALSSPNAEIARRARRILARGAKQGDPEVAEAAARLLARRHPPGAIPVLLGYLPFTDDGRVERTIHSALAGIQGPCPRLHPAILKALNDPEPARRAAAAYALGQWEGAAPRRELGELLKDPVLKVRLHAAQALVKSADHRGIPRLIDLLAEAPLPLAWQAERFLARVAGRKAPAVALQATPRSRRRVRLAWQGWWKENRGTLRLSPPDLKDRSSPLILFTDLDEGRVVALGMLWKEQWVVDELQGPTDVQLLASGRLLVAENHAGRVTERNRDGRVLWEKKTGSYPLSCWRLDSGNTVIATRNELLEATPEGRTVWSRKWSEEVWCARPMRDGGIVVLARDRDLVYLTSAGREVRRVQLEQPAQRWSRFTLLPGGDLLLAGYNNGFEVVQLDRDGSKVWDYKRFKSVGAARLPNGHTLVTDNREELLLEVDRAGKIVRQRKVGGCPWDVQVVLP